MHRVLTITEKASDLSLLTDAEMRVAAGLAATDGSKDAILRPRGLAIAANIMTECNIAVGAGNDPTLLQETLTESLYHFDATELCLARRHNVELSSLTIDGAAAEVSDYLLDPESGIVSRPDDCGHHRWCARSITVVYKAGFAEVPPDLKNAALDYFRAVTMESARDPYVKAETVDIPGVLNKKIELWSGSLPGAAPSNTVPDAVVGQLARFRNPLSF